MPYVYTLDIFAIMTILRISKFSILDYASLWGLRCVRDWSAG
jgi:hypothetical protein